MSSKRPPRVGKPVVADTSFLVNAMAGANGCTQDISLSCEKLFRRIARRDFFYFNNATWGEFEYVAKRPETLPGLDAAARDQFIWDVFGHSRLVRAPLRIVTSEGPGDDMVLSVALAHRAPVVTCDKHMLDLRGTRNDLPEINSVGDMFARLSGQMRPQVRPRAQRQRTGLSWSGQVQHA